MTDREMLELLLKEVTGMKSKLEKIDNKVDTIETDVKDIKLTLENEIRTNIQRVAEGHLDLSGNLKEVIQTNNDYEILMIKVNTLESKVRELERKIS